MSQPKPPPRRARADTALYVTIFVFLAVQTAAASAQHAHDAFVAGGQGNPAWLPWTLAGTPELMAVLATLEYRHRRKHYGSDVDVRVPRAVIVASALVLMGAQLVTAKHTVLGLFAAAWPAVAFLIAVALIESRPRIVDAAVAPARPRARKIGAPPVHEAGGTTPEPDPPAVPDPVEGDDEWPRPRLVPTPVGALDDNAQAVFAALDRADGPLTTSSLRASTSLDKDRLRRALDRLAGAGLAQSPQRGQWQTVPDAAAVS
jgi:hypothetical protein